MIFYHVMWKLKRWQRGIWHQACIQCGIFFVAFFNSTRLAVCCCCLQSLDIWWCGLNVWVYLHSCCCCCWCRCCCFFIMICAAVVLSSNSPFFRVTDEMETAPQLYTFFFADTIKEMFTSIYGWWEWHDIALIWNTSKCIRIRWWCVLSSTYGNCDCRILNYLCVQIDINADFVSVFSFKICCCLVFFRFCFFVCVVHFDGPLITSMFYCQRPMKL